MTDAIHTLRQPGAAADAAQAPRLVIQPGRRDIDPAVDLPLAPGCFLGVEDAYPEWERLPFTDAVSQADDFPAASRDAIVLAHVLSRELAPDFNRRHGTAHGADFWRLLLVPWIVAVFQIVWRRYREVEATVAAHGHRPLRVEVPAGDVQWDVADMQDLYSGLFVAPGFQAWLTGRILARLAPHAWQLEPVPAQTTWTPTPFVSQAPHGGGLKGLVRRLRAQWRCRGVKGVRLSAPLLSAWLSLLPGKPRLPLPWADVSLAAAEARFPPVLVAIFREVLDATVPRTLRTDFAALSAGGARRRFRPGKIMLVGSLPIYDEPVKLEMAHAVERGERIVCTQHGGCGYVKVNTNSTAVELLQDAFLSWGWTRQEDYAGRIVPVPSPDLSPYRDRHSEREAALYVVGTSIRVLSGRLETTHLPAQGVRARLAKRALLEALPPDLFAATRYRAYEGDTGVLEDETYFRRHFPTLALCRGPLHPQLLAGRLLVVDHPTTTFAFALIANVPLIALWSRDTWPPSRQAAPLFEGLERAGILIDDPRRAADAVTRVWSDTASWWRSAPVQDARRAFLDRYLWTDRLWLLKWMKALAAL